MLAICQIFGRIWYPRVRGKRFSHVAWSGAGTFATRIRGVKTNRTKVFKTIAVRTSNLNYQFTLRNNCMFVCGNKIRSSVEQVSFHTFPKWAFRRVCKKNCKNDIEVLYEPLKDKNAARRSFKKNEMCLYGITILKSVTR